jgi:hypothetical protein
MIGHTTKGMNTIAKPGRTFLQEEVKAAIIFIGQENILPAIASQHDVINPAGDMNPWFACHGFIIFNKCFLSTWKPDPFSFCCQLGSLTPCCLSFSKKNPPSQKNKDGGLDKIFNTLSNNSIEQ